MTSSVLAVVLLDKLTGIPADRVQNSWVFETPSTPPATADITLINSALHEFYDVASRGPDSVAKLYADCITRGAGAHHVEYYNLDGHLDGSPHGGPIDIRPLGMTSAPSSANSLPDEIACCLSFQGLYGTDVEFGAGVRPRARDRGRIYLGPFNHDVIAQAAGDRECQIDDGFMQTAAASAARLLTTSNSSGVPWCQWSRAAQRTQPVSNGWIDNAPDIQRRRGFRPFARRLF